MPPKASMAVAALFSRVATSLVMFRGSTTTPRGACFPLQPALTLCMEGVGGIHGHVWPAGLRPASFWEAVVTLVDTLALWETTIYSRRVQSAFWSLKC